MLVFRKVCYILFLILECSTSQEKENKKQEQAGLSQDEQAAGGGTVVQDAAQLKQGDNT